MTEYMESYPNKNILFVTHGGLMILIQEVIEGKKMERGSINNCDIIEYSFNHKKIMKNKLIKLFFILAYSISFSASAFSNHKNSHKKLYLKLSICKSKHFQ